MINSDFDSQNLRVCFSVIILGIHDNHQIGRHTHAPGETARGHQHLYSTAREQMLHRLPLYVTQALMEVPHAITECLLQGLQIINICKKFDKTYNFFSFHYSKNLFEIISIP